ncbi:MULTISPECIES: hypothetical protein [unclassified Microcoleus]|uniref:hypothetical protein n=1 Tax=unclassified Microcoleus TaxID=2642155 RepID=UPI002FCFEB19
MKDNGLGITREVRTHLFSPFFTTEPAGQDTGLGLFDYLSDCGGEARRRFEVFITANRTGCIICD